MTRSTLRRGWVILAVAWAALVVSHYTHGLVAAAATGVVVALTCAAGINARIGKRGLVDRTRWRIARLTPRERATLHGEDKP